MATLDIPTDDLAGAPGSANFDRVQQEQSSPGLPAEKILDRKLRNATRLAEAYGQGAGDWVEYQPVPQFDPADVTVKDWIDEQLEPGTYDVFFSSWLPNVYDKLEGRSVTVTGKKISVLSVERDADAGRRVRMRIRIGNPFVVPLGVILVALAGAVGSIGLVFLVREVRKVSTVAGFNVFPLLLLGGGFFLLRGAL